MTFAVLVVCTGNLCRSVAAEQLLRATLPATDVELMSVGTHAQPGQPCHELTVRALAATGFAATAHRSQRIAPEAVRVADLVLTATRDHRLAAVDADPSAARRTFTILEFARLVGQDTEPVTSLVELRDRAVARRATAPATADDDLGDPVLGGYEDHVEMLRSLVPAVRAIAEAAARVRVPV